MRGGRDGGAVGKKGPVKRALLFLGGESVE